MNKPFPRRKKGKKSSRPLSRDRVDTNQYNTFDLSNSVFEYPLDSSSSTNITGQETYMNPFATGNINTLTGFGSVQTNNRQTNFNNQSVRPVIHNHDKSSSDFSSADHSDFHTCNEYEHLISAESSSATETDSGFVTCPEYVVEINSSIPAEQPSNTSQCLSTASDLVLPELASLSLEDNNRSQNNKSDNMQSLMAAASAKRAQNRK